MNKKSTFLTLFLGLVFLGTTAFGQQRTLSANPMTWSPIRATRLIGEQVHGYRGHYLGQISSFVIDQVNDRVALAVLSDVPGLGSREVAIPYNCLDRTGRGRFATYFPNTMMGLSSDLHFLTGAPEDSNLYGIPHPIDPNWVADVYKYYGEPPYWHEKGARSLSASELYQSTRLIGHTVWSSQGRMEATADDLVIDSSNGKIAVLILSHIKGRGDDLVAVPFDTLKRTDEGTFALNVMGDDLAIGAKRFQTSDMHSPGYGEYGGYAADVYRSFGLRPSWTAGGTTRGTNPYRWGGTAQDF